MTIPLLLKIKQGQLLPLFVKSSDTNVQFQNKEYKFAAIYENDISESILDRLTGQSCALVLMGPTGSGKTTTLRSILDHQMNKDGETYFTACEVSENRSFADIVDNCKRKRYVSSLPMDKQLKKTKLAQSAMEKVFSERKTSSTVSNATSSRSCLIVTLYNDKKTVTIVDMMGNEKYDAANSTSNVFANSNVSSITQLLLTRTTRTRSSNLVTNLIFQKLSLSKMKFILHLDECGNAELIKSSLCNIVDVVKDFRVEPSRSVARPSLATKNVPNYARPTVSSLSPRKKSVAKSIRITKPKLNVFTPLTKRPSLARSATETPCVRKKPTNRTMENLYQVELKSLKDQNAQLTQKNMELLSLAHEAKETTAKSITELKEHLSAFRAQELLSLKESLAGVKNGFLALESDHSSMVAEMLSKEREIDTFKASKLEAEDQIQKLKEIQSANQSEIEYSKQETLTLQGNIEQLEKEVSTLKVQVDDFHKRIGSLTEDVSTRDESIKSLERDMESRQKKITEFEHSIAIHRDEIESLESTITSLNEQLEKLNSTSELMKKQVDTLEEQLATLKNQIASFEGQMSSEKEQISLQEQKISSLHAELLQKEQTLKDSVAEKQKLQEVHQEELDKKIQESQILQQQLELQSAALDKSQNAIQQQKSQIEILESENSKTSTENSEAKISLQAKEEALTILTSENADLQEKLNTQTRRIEAADAQYKKDREVHSSKLQSTQKNLEKVIAEKEELTKKHNDLISYNKYIVEKYSSALDKNDVLNKEEQGKFESTIKELQAKLKSQKDEHQKIVHDLTVQVESQEMEMSELEKYKAKCTNLENTARAVRDESIEQIAFYETEIAQLKSEIDSFRSLEVTNGQLQAELDSFRHVKLSNLELTNTVDRFKTPSPQKLPFNPSSDIFEDDHQPNKDYLKALRQSMKSSPKNVLRDSNTLSSEKKKLKRKALSYISSVKSPKVVSR